MSAMPCHRAAKSSSKSSWSWSSEAAAGGGELVGDAVSASAIGRGLRPGEPTSPSSLSSLSSSSRVWIRCTRSLKFTLPPLALLSCPRVRPVLDPLDAAAAAAAVGLGSATTEISCQPSLPDARLSEVSSGETRSSVMARCTICRRLLLRTTFLPTGPAAVELVASGAVRGPSKLCLLRRPAAGLRSPFALPLGLGPAFAAPLDLGVHWLSPRSWCVLTKFDPVFWVSFFRAAR
mmetsp:Transcript_10953/g.31418  ORF Transcript_10953/g.31418 Transcript_10953/m.31418 type:complete len:234 (-) Transcript_10953:439-1140(-)